MRHGSRYHGAEAKFCQLVTLVRSQSANATDLNANGTQVGKTTECECCDGERARIEGSFLRSQQCVCIQLINDHARAKQIADGAAVMFRYADEPRHWREDEAEDFLNASGEPTDVIVRPAHDAVQERDQC